MRFLFHFTFLFILNAIVCFPSYKKICSELSDEIVLELNKKITFEFDLPAKFDSGLVKGEGVNGKVVQIDLPFEEFTTGAVKRIKINEHTSKEIYLIKEMGELDFSPKLISCHYETDIVFEPMIYIVMEVKKFDLGDLQTRKKFKALEPKKRLYHYYTILKAIAKLWDLGFVHNDIKPGNFLLDEKLERIYLIDFGIASRIHSTLNPCGTAFFIAPDKFLKVPANQKMDLYSWAMSIGFLEGNLVEEPINSDLVSNKSFKIKFWEKSLSQDCFTKKRSEDCKTKLFDNIIKILKPIYGDYIEKETPHSMLYPNFTTFIASIILYDDFSLNLEDSLTKMFLLMNRFIYLKMPLNNEIVHLIYSADEPKLLSPKQKTSEKSSNKVFQKDDLSNKEKSSDVSFIEDHFEIII